MTERPSAPRDREIADLVDNLRRVFRVVHRYSKRAEKVGGLTGPQVWAMKVVSESAPIRVTDLARRMYLHPSTVVGILDRLEQQDQVARTRSEKGDDQAQLDRVLRDSRRDAESQQRPGRARRRAAREPRHRAGPQGGRAGRPAEIEAALGRAVTIRPDAHLHHEQFDVMAT